MECVVTGGLDDACVGVALQVGFGTDWTRFVGVGGIVEMCRWEEFEAAVRMRQGEVSAAGRLRS
jgi:hypothetical protein